MASRTAEAIIKGYYYQFDTSILKLLELQNDSDSIIIEGIEDIDIRTANDTTTVQCKYLSNPKFTNPVVRKPILLMLDHFVNPQTPNNLNYVLYAHFEIESLGNEPVIDLAKLKEILTYSENGIEYHYEKVKGISDAQLLTFISQFKLTFGAEFYAQQKQIIDKLAIQFRCSESTANSFYYNNSLRIILNKAIQKGTSNREITKAEFIQKVDCSKVLFSEWFIRLRSKKEYLKLVADSFKSTKALDPTKSKVIVIGKNIITNNNPELPIELFLEKLIDKYYTMNSLRSAKPLTVAIDCDAVRLRSIKTHLIDNELLYNDGYEDIKFSCPIFNREPIVNTTMNSAKIVKSSYYIKLISKNTFISNFSSITSPKVMFNFSNEDLDVRLPNGQFFDLKYCENLKEIYKLLVP